MKRNTEIILGLMFIFLVGTIACVYDLGKDIQEYEQDMEIDLCSYNKFNCSSFETQEQAQSLFEYCGIKEDVHFLDMDNDSIACESLN